MALPIPADQVSVRGVISSSIGGSSVKPVSFNYQPNFIQKRVQSFDDEGYMLPGIPVIQAKDSKITASYGTVNSGLIGLAAVDPDEFYTAAVNFALTDGGAIAFGASGLVVDGQGLSIDPLADSMQITYIITDPGSVDWT